MAEVSEEVKGSVLMWLKTFSLAEESVKGFGDLGDSLVLEQVLHQVSPSHFAYASSDRDAMRSDWVLASHHVSSVLESMVVYFEEAFKKTIDISDISPASIAREKNEAHILKWVQLVVGSVVMCSQKEIFIKRIFNLPRSAQNVLKTLVEAFMHSIKDHVPGNSPRDTSDELMTKHLRSERDALIKEVNELKLRNLELHTKIEKENESNRDGGGQRPGVRAHDEASTSSAFGGMEGTGAHSTVSATTALKVKVEELERAVDEKGLEYNILMEEMSQKTAALAKCEEEKRGLTQRVDEMSDDLEAAKDTALKLAKAESTILKYQQKLDDYVALRREHKGQLEQLEMYQTIEQHLESEQEKVAALKEELSVARREGKALQEEKSAFATLLVDKQSTLDEALERCEALEEEAKHLKGIAGVAPGGETKKTSGDDEDDEVDEGEGDEEEEDEEEEIEDVEIEAPPPHTASHSHADSDAQMADLRVKLTHAEAELVDTHTQLERLGRERDRLETYSRESIQAFQRKFTSTLQNVNEEKEMLEGALERLADRCEFDRETFRREERLLLSALHSLGVQMMEMNVKRHHLGLAAAGAGFGAVTTEPGAWLSPAPRSILGGSQQRQSEALDSLLA